MPLTQNNERIVSVFFLIYEHVDMDHMLARTFVHFFRPLLENDDKNGDLEGISGKRGNRSRV